MTDEQELAHALRQASAAWNAPDWEAVAERLALTLRQIVRNGDMVVARDNIQEYKFFTQEAIGQATKALAAYEAAKAIPEDDDLLW